MANYHTQLSLEIGPLTQAAHDWLQAEATKVNDSPEFEDHLNCEFLFRPTAEHYTLWIHAEDGPNIEALVTLLSAYLEKFDPQRVIAVQWAHTCSSPRTDGFGGGACVVTAKHTHWVDTQNWLYEKVKSLGLEEV